MKKNEIQDIDEYYEKLRLEIYNSISVDMWNIRLSCIRKHLFTDNLVYYCTKLVVSNFMNTDPNVIKTIEKTVLNSLPDIIFKDKEFRLLRTEKYHIESVLPDLNTINITFYLW